MNKSILVFGIILLFIISSVTPMTIGQSVETTNVDVELEEMIWQVFTDFEMR